MRAAVVIESIEPSRGGAETSTTEFVRILALNGVSVVVITADGGTAVGPARVIALPVGGPRGRRLSRFITLAGQHIAANSYDIVHAMVPMPSADIYEPRGGLMRETISRNVALRRNPIARSIKRLLSGVNPKYRALLELEEAVCRPDGPRIVAVSEYVARQCRAHYGLVAPRVQVVFNGVNIESAAAETRATDRGFVRRQFNIPPDAFLMLCVAHNFRLKGLGVLLDAAARLRRDDWRLAIVGRDNPGSFARQARRLGIASRIIFCGHAEAIRPFYHAADVCVHPTYYDPCSRVVLEALSIGLPAITTRFNGASEVMQDGVHGFVIDAPDDISALADRLNRMYDPALRERMSIEAARICPALRMDRHVAGVLKIYRQVMAARDGAQVRPRPAVEGQKSS